MIRIAQHITKSIALNLLTTSTEIVAVQWRHTTPRSGCSNGLTRVNTLMQPRLRPPMQQTRQAHPLCSVCLSHGWKPRHIINIGFAVVLVRRSSSCFAFSHICSYPALMLYPTYSTTPNGSACAVTRNGRPT
jgi:hypothetical protein